MIGICGAVGSGKTSLIDAILGQVRSRRNNSSISIWFSFMSRLPSPAEIPMLFIFPEIPMLFIFPGFALCFLKHRILS